MHLTNTFIFISSRTSSSLYNERLMSLFSCWFSVHIVLICTMVVSKNSSSVNSRLPWPYVLELFHACAVLGLPGSSSVKITNCRFVNFPRIIDEMVKCQTKNCRFVAAFCYSGPPEFCASHKQEGMTRFVAGSSAACEGRPRRFVTPSHLGNWLLFLPLHLNKLMEVMLLA